MNRFSLAMLVATATLSLPACSIDREDVLECGLPGGGKFVLRAPYEYVPLIAWLPINRHGSDRSNQGYFSIDYARGNRIISSGYSTEHRRLDRPNALEVARQICAETGGELNHVIYIGGREIIDSSALAVTNFTLGEKFRLSYGPGETPRRLLDELDARKVYPADSAATIEAGRVIFEQSLVYEGGIIGGVFQAFSMDQGRTWSDPTITTDALIFELGKPLLAQRFIARPISINGKRADAGASTAR